MFLKKIFLCGLAITMLFTAVGCKAPTGETYPVSTPPDDGRIVGTKLQDGVYRLDWLTEQLKGVEVTDVALYNNEMILIAFVQEQNVAGYAVFDLLGGVQVYRQTVSCTYLPILQVWNDGSFSLVSSQQQGSACLFFRNLFDTSPLSVAPVTQGQRIFVDKTKYYDLINNVLYVGTAITDTYEQLCDLSSEYQACTALGANNGFVRLACTQQTNDTLTEVLCVESSATFRAVSSLSVSVQSSDITDGDFYLRNNGTATVLIYQNGENIQTVSLKTAQEAVFACSEKWLVTANDTIQIYNRTDGTVQYTYPYASVTQADLSPDQTLLLVWDTAYYVLDLA